MKRFFTFLFSIIVSLTSSSGFAAEIEVAISKSGIDLDTSTLQITNFTGPNPTTCSLTNPTPLSDPLLNFININGNTIDQEIVNLTCFKEVGTYSLTLSLVDMAGNIATPETYDLTIKPAEASIPQSTFTHCSSFIADNSDDCATTVTLKDEFGNLIPNRVDNTLSINGQQVNGSYDTTLDASEAFINGIRFDFTSTPAEKTDVNGNLLLDITAMVPSLEIIDSNLVDNDGNPLFQLGKEMARSVLFNLKTPKIDDYGDIIAATFEILDLSTNLTATPPLRTEISDNDGADPSDPLDFIFGSPKTFYVNRTESGNLSNPVMNTLGVLIKGLSPVGTVFINEDLTTGYLLDAITNSFVTKLMLEIGGTPTTDLAVTFGTVINYSAKALDPVNVSNNNNIIYPSTTLGNMVGTDFVFDDPEDIETCNPSETSEVSAIIVGADIEGQVLMTNNTLATNPGDNLLNMGGTTTKDMREGITRSVYELLRGRNYIDASGGKILDISSDSIANFGENDVLYYNGGTVTIGTGGQTFVGGQRTIVIENGNLFIKGDIVYGNDTTDSLGIVLINSDCNDKQLGNIFIDNDVQKIIGTYFSDGGIMSSATTLTAVPTLATIFADDGVVANRNIDGGNSSSVFGKQLLLEGTLLTRNTLGGYVTLPLFTPFGIASTVEIPGLSSDEEEAILYDAHFIRRYIPSSTSSNTIVDNPGCVPDVADPTFCEANSHSFVIRPDGRVKIYTPPGFDSAATVIAH
ncbi:hypothetical protein KAI58_01765 [Candidatus Gracilibacteria bacterium]|nr:hypothetical protein [Candidatus Gracilibacteria bacterium]